MDTSLEHLRVTTIGLRLDDADWSCGASKLFFWHETRDRRYENKFAINHVITAAAFLDFRSILVECRIRLMIKVLPKGIFQVSYRWHTISQGHLCLGSGRGVTELSFLTRDHGERVKKAVVRIAITFRELHSQVKLCLHTWELCNYDGTVCSFRNLIWSFGAFSVCRNLILRFKLTESFSILRESLVHTRVNASYVKLQCRRYAEFGAFFYCPEGCV